MLLRGFLVCRINRRRNARDGVAVVLLLLFVTIYQDLPQSELRGIGRHGPLSFSGFAHHLIGGKRLREFAGRHPQSAVLDEAAIERGIGNLSRIELLVNPIVEPHGLDPFDVPGTRPKGEPLQGMHHAIVLGQSRRWLRLLARRACGVRRKNGWAREQENE